jgi:tetratricopeptide (TPR) repeat protein
MWYIPTMGLLLALVDVWSYRMRIIQVTGILSALLFSLACFCSCAGSEPSWAEHATAAKSAFRSGNITEGDRQAKLVLAESGHYGDKMPPSAYGSWEYHFLPMQDSSEYLSYSGNLRMLASKYIDAKKSEDAESFLRKALELDSAEYGPNSHIIVTYSLPPLIRLLESKGRTKEAGELQERLASARQLQATQNPNQSLDQLQASKEQAKAFEMQGKFDDAEVYWQKRVDLSKSDLPNKEYLATLKRANIKSEQRKGGMRMPSIIGALNDLASFYDRQKNYVKEEKALLQAQSVRQEILPESSPFLAEGWEKLWSVYEKQHKYDEATKAIRQRINCLEANDSRQDNYPLAWSYHKYAELLQRLGRQPEALLAKQNAHGNHIFVH